MSGFPYTLDPPPPLPLGLIVLQSDETVESDFRRLFADVNRAIHVTRIPSGTAVTPETLARMEAELPRTADLLPPVQYAAVGYGCTSGTTMIGVDRVAELVGSGCNTRAICDPLSAAHTACAYLGIRKLGVVSPYRADVAQPVSDALAIGDTQVAQSVHFGEEVEANVARISPDSVIAAAKSVAKNGEVDGIFLSCTNLRTLDVIATLEEQLGLPVFGSNLALAWAMAQAAGVTPRLKGDFSLLASLAPCAARSLVQTDWQSDHPAQRPTR